VLGPPEAVAQYRQMAQRIADAHGEA